MLETPTAVPKYWKRTSETVIELNVQNELTGDQLLTESILHRTQQGEGKATKLWEELKMFLEKKLKNLHPQIFLIRKMEQKILILQSCCTYKGTKPYRKMDVEKIIFCPLCMEWRDPESLWSKLAFLLLSAEKIQGRNGFFGMLTFCDLFDSHWWISW